MIYTVDPFQINPKTVNLGHINLILSFEVEHFLFKGRDPLSCFKVVLSHFVKANLEFGILFTNVFQSNDLLVEAFTVSTLALVVVLEGGKLTVQMAPHLL